MSEFKQCIEMVKDSKENQVIPVEDVVRKDSVEYQALSSNGSLPCDASAHDGSSDDDWETIADRAPNELLSPPSLPDVSTLSMEDNKAQITKRRGRGTFSYQKEELYSDRQSEGSTLDDTRDEAVCHDSEEKTEIRHSRYGTQHVLVLADFPPSMRTTDLEKLFENFRDREVVIRWVNDTMALAVFRTATIAIEACNFVRCPFTVRVLDETDILLNSIQTRDLEPPRQRPETSARTAGRLIAQAMGMKLPSTSFGSRELKKQEEARKQRIVARKNLKDDAWGSDDGVN
ncbi:uncharacterized protein LOC100242804 isoform X1 [Vitis vinifera]|uniref:uncharacterized protein LOC100242804 isoform X1 n=2 Tax=Vitis vinifera TaxID=29760 RepID=UPI00053FB2DA|nr:uncharacterized protein LOC100242804 isoform X1 [Vitis vinifera]|eukprot:XP_010651654.1 PREDICTED: coiled-coil domain-containing protein R3HCC1L isoform X1 [Vitis vinifera]